MAGITEGASMLTRPAEEYENDVSEVGIIVFLMGETLKDLKTVSPCYFRLA